MSLDSLVGLEEIIMDFEKATILDASKSSIDRDVNETDLLYMQISSSKFSYFDRGSNWSKNYGRSRIIK